MFSSVLVKADTNPGIKKRNSGVGFRFPNELIRESGLFIGELVFDLWALINFDGL